MHSWLEAIVYVAAGLALVAAVVAFLRDRPVGDPEYIALGVVEALVVLQLVLGSVALAGTDRDVNGTLFVSYLVGLVLVLPLGAFWSLAERSRAGTAVLILAVFTVVALELRLHAIWTGSGA